MSARAGPGAALVLAASLAVLPLLLRPELALAAGVAAVLAWLACRSVAYPVALAGVPPIVFGVFGEGPVPEGVASVVLASGVALAVGVAVHRREEVPPARVVVGVPAVLSLLLLALLVLREPIRPETDYAQLKTGFFVVNNLVFLVGGVFVGWSVRGLETLLSTVLAVSVAGAVLVVLHVAGGGDQSVLPVALTFSDGDHSISMGRQMAVGILIALFFTLGAGDASRRLLAMASLPLLVAALIASGARGPVVALIAGLVALLLLAAGDRTARQRMMAVIGAAAVTVALVQAVVPAASLGRAFSFATTDVDSSSSGRTDLWEQSVRLIAEHPGDGIGTGAFAEVDPHMIYPHNLVLEVGVELGVAGIALVLALLLHAGGRLAAARRRARGPDRMAVAVVLALFLAAATNAMFSFALHSNWEVWLWAGVGTALAARLARERHAGFA